MEDYGLDMDEVVRVIENADVLVVRFAIVDKRLLIDARTTDTEGPLIAVVPKAGSVEERFKALKKLRPRFSLPEKIMSFTWPRHVDTFRSSGLADRIEFRLDGGGLQPIALVDGPFDLVFIDADKPNYKNYYEAVLPKLADDGLIVIDNVLWSGRVVEDADDDESTRAIKEINDHVRNDPRVECVMLTVRDGMLLVRKR
jgi:Predicted O-methyltransferase